MRSNGSPAAPRPCEGCGSQFAPKRRWQRFCKTSCRTLWHGSHGRPPVARIEDLERRVAELERRLQVLAEPVR